MHPKDPLDSGSLNQVEAVLERCLQLPELEFAAAVDAACAEHPDLADSLRRHVARLRGLGLVPTGRAGASPTPLVGETAPTIPGYQVFEVIGQGGMGTVFRAEQQDPIRRVVAIKVIKPGMDSADIVSRFARERQALALMDHDCIAKVFDCGVTDSSRPFFAMEFVPGVPIHRYCDERRLPLRSRIKLFQRICAGVQHAHQKGVIHRDLKPHNVLVSSADEPTVKVIDFGLARAVEGDPALGTQHTMHGTVVGTQEYMSPEQSVGAGDRIDTRTDVYSLGVILYELLVGALPFPSEELRGLPLAEVQRRLREGETPKPSIRLSSLGPAAETVASHRGIRVEALRRALAGELDWIVLRAMAKEPERRYASANELRLDLQRFLDHEPVEAGPPSRRYRMSKFVRRYRGQVVAACAVLLSLTIGLVVSTVLWLSNAELAHDKGELAKAESRQRGAAEAEARRAQAAEADAEARSNELEQVAGFQASQLEEIDLKSMAVDLRRHLLARARSGMSAKGLDTASIESHIAALDRGLAFSQLPDVARDALVDGLFRRSLDSIDKRFGDQPLLRAKLLQSTAEIMVNLGMLQAAREPQRRALEIRQRELGEAAMSTLESRVEAARLHYYLAEFAECERVVRRVLDTPVAMLGADDPLRDTAMSVLATVLEARNEHLEEARLRRELFDRVKKRLGPDATTTWRALASLGTALGPTDPKLAVQHLRRAVDGLAASGDAVHAARAEQHLADALVAAGEYGEAEVRLRACCERIQQELGEEHQFTLNARWSLAQLLLKRGDAVAAEPIVTQVHQGLAKLFGEHHQYTNGAAQTLGQTYVQLGRPAEAEILLRRCLDRELAMFGKDSFDTAQGWAQLGTVLYAQKRWEQCEKCLAEFLRIARLRFPPEHAEVLLGLENLAAVMVEQGKLEQAKKILVESSEAKRRAVGPTHPSYLRSRANLGVLLVRAKDYLAAETLLREVVRECQGAMPEPNGTTALALVSLGQALQNLKKFEAAEECYRRGLGCLEKLLPAGHERIRVAYHQLVMTLAFRADADLAAGDFETAQKRLLEAQQFCDSKLDPKDSCRVTTPRRLARLYEAWHETDPAGGHDREAARWRKLQPGK